MISATTDATVSATTSVRTGDEEEESFPTNTTAKARGTISLPTNFRYIVIIGFV